MATGVQTMKFITERTFGRRKTSASLYFYSKIVSICSIFTV
jgi:hypothetical protein